MSDPEGPRSVSRRFRLHIAASPFNAVKLDLALIILLVVCVFLLLAGLETSRALDSLILLAVAGCGALWLVVRTRRVVRAQERDHGEKQE